MNPGTPLKIAIETSGISHEGGSGGTGQALLSLIHELGKLTDGPESYVILARWWDQLKWLQPYCGPNQKILVRHPETHGVIRDGRIHYPGLRNYALRPLRFIKKLLTVPGPPRFRPEVPMSDGYYENLGCHVLHFMNQMDFVLCALPTVYNPHDLQHLHYPQYWTPAAIAERETIYPAACHFANTVIVGSQWVKTDVARQYGVSPTKIQVIPEGPPTQSYAKPSEESLAAVKDKYKLEQPFIIYPSVTWQHKNHIRLLEALAYLRDTRGPIVRLVCTGTLDAYWPQIEKRVDELNLSQQVRFLGFVPEDDLRCLYRLAECLVMPSLFEAVSLPIFEAWFEGTPVACSDVTALPDQVLDAALIFDPLDVGSIADAIAKLVADPELRRDLVTRGYRRLQDFDCQRTAKAYRAVYRRAAGFPLSEEDRRLLSWDWMRDPQGTRQAVSSSCTPRSPV